MEIIIYDFEVFKYNTLLGAIIFKDDKATIYQTWDLKCMKTFYESHKDAVFVGWNNYEYDDFILDGILNGENPYNTSHLIIKQRYKPKLINKILSYDIMFDIDKLSLKLTELIAGKNIHTSEIDFEINRPLTDEEKQLVEKYNEDDLKMTAYNFKMFQDRFLLKIDMAEEFGLDLSKTFKSTEQQLACLVLNAKKIYGIENKLVKPKIYPNMHIKNQELMNFYLNEDFKKGKTITINVCDTELTIGAGGTHSAKKQCIGEHLLYLDVKGYYNLIMMLYDLLPRSISKEGKELYEHMYYEQQKLKTTNPRKRAVYKKVLLAVFGGQKCEGSAFYDPEQFYMVSALGQVYIVQLLESLEGLVNVFQANTDGVMLEIKDEKNYDLVKSIVDNWTKETGFVVKEEHIEQIFQRDVNTYFAKIDGEVVVKGDGMKNYDISPKGYATGEIFRSKEPPIISQGTVACLLDGIMPEEYVEANQKDLRLFQYACCKNTYKKTEYEEFDIETKDKKITPLQGIDRAFALKSNHLIGMVYKVGTSKNPTSRAKVSNLPETVFIYNDNITNENAYIELKDKIDYNYYIKRIYQKISQFIGGE